MIRNRMSTLTAMAAAIAAAALLALAPACTETTYQFDEVDVGSEDGDRAPRAKSNSQFLRSVFADMLGRNPETYDFVVSFDGVEAFRFPIDEQGLLGDTLEGVGDPTPMRNLLVAGMVESAEAAIPAKSEVADPEAYIADQFRKLLGRDPGAYELAAFVDAWETDPAVTPKTVVRALLGSREYQST